MVSLIGTKQIRAEEHLKKTVNKYLKGVVLIKYEYNIVYAAHFSMHDPYKDRYDIQNRQKIKKIKYHLFRPMYLF